MTDEPDCQEWNAHLGEMSAADEGGTSADVALECGGIIGTGNFGYACLFRNDLSGHSKLLSSVFDSTYRACRYGPGQFIVSGTGRGKIPNIPSLFSLRGEESSVVGGDTVGQAVVVLCDYEEQRVVHVLSDEDMLGAPIWCSALTPIWTSSEDYPTHILVGRSFRERGEGNTFAIFNSDTGNLAEKHGTVPGDDCPACLCALALPRFRGQVLLGGADGVCNWDIDHGMASKKYDAKGNFIHGMDVSLKHNLLVAGSRFCGGQKLTGFSFRTAEVAFQLELGYGHYSVCCVDDKNCFAVGVTGGFIAVYDPRNFSEKLREFQAHQKHPNSFYYVFDMDRLDESTFLTASENSSISMWDIEKGEVSGFKLTESQARGVCAFPGYEFDQVSRLDRIDAEERVSHLLGRPELFRVALKIGIVSLRFPGGFLRS